MQNMSGRNFKLDATSQIAYELANFGVQLLAGIVKTRENSS